MVEPQRRGLLARRAGGRQPGATTGGATLPRRWARIENGPVEIVDLPINSIVDFSIVFRMFTRGYGIMPFMIYNHFLYNNHLSW